MDARISLTRSTGKVLQERLQGAYTRGDYNPIEYLWRNTKKRATHAKYFERFAAKSSRLWNAPWSIVRPPLKQSWRSLGGTATRLA